MSDTDSWPRNIVFKNLRKSLSRLGSTIDISSRSVFELERQKARLPFDKLPVQLSLGTDQKKLQLIPETALTEKGKLRSTGSILLFDPENAATGFRCFLRLDPGQMLTIGRDNTSQVSLLGLHEGIGRRHLTLTVFDDELLLKNHEPDSPVSVEPLDASVVAGYVERRIRTLGRLRKLLGGRIEPLPPEAALALLEEVNGLLASEAHRPTDRRGMPGGLVSLPDKMVPFIIGDLHARIENLLSLLSQEGVLDTLEKGEAVLVFLGDAVHREDDGRLEEMESSMIMMDLIFRLKRQFPAQVFYLRGNHDSFSEEIGKAGVPQGSLWRRHLRKQRGKRYRKAMERFYELLPYVISSQRFLACHAGAPQAKVDRDMLVNIREYPALERELTENRLKHPGRHKGYTRGDVKRFRKRIGLGEEAPFVVGHTPMSPDETLWMNVGEIAGHHVVYSGGDEWVGAMARVGDCMAPLRYPAESLLELYNRLAD